jgi:cytochrome P450
MIYDPNDPDFQADPYAAYARIRDTAPVHRARLGVWVLSRYVDVAEALRSKRLTSDPFAWALYPEVAESVYGAPDCPLLNLQRAWMMLRDGESHAAARRIVGSAMASDSLEDAAQHAAQMASELVSGFRSQGGGDFIQSIAKAIPLKVICYLLGMPYAEGVQCHVWLDKILATFGLGSVRPEDVAEANQAAMQIQQYFAQLLAQRRAHPRGDVLSRIIESWPDELSGEELVANAVLLFSAGHETTANLIGNGILALMLHPDHWRGLSARSELATPVVDEVLRYDAPVQVVSRSALTDITIAGHHVESGDHVALLLGSANRDPARFAQPDLFDPHRRSNLALSFGAGVHYCLGARLARLEAEAAFVESIRGLPGLRFADKRPEWAATSSHRGLVSLPLICSDIEIRGDDG